MHRGRRVTVRRRQRRKLGPHRLAALLGVPRSTCYAVLRRHGLQRSFTSLLHVYTK